MIRFECDYLEGMHEKILQKLQETNREQYPGYGSDPHTEHAKAILRSFAAMDMRRCTCWWAAHRLT